MSPELRAARLAYHAAYARWWRANRALQAAGWTGGTSMADEVISGAVSHLEADRDRLQAAAREVRER